VRWCFSNPRPAGRAHPRGENALSPLQLSFLLCSIDYRLYFPSLHSASRCLGFRHCFNARLNSTVVSWSRRRDHAFVKQSTDILLSSEQETAENLTACPFHHSLENRKHSHIKKASVTSTPGCHQKRKKNYQLGSPHSQSH
jgi:hypothetical protein